MNSLSLPGPDDPAILQREALAQIQAALTTARARFAVQSRLAIQFRCEKSALTTSLENSTFPVLSLPNEITSLIFIACLPSEGDVRPSHRRAPLLLLRVCRHWRRVALDMAQLWCSLDLNVGRGDWRCISLKRGSWEDVKTWFARAKNQYLSLTIRQWRSWPDARPSEHDCWPPSFDNVFDSKIQFLKKLSADVSAFQMKGIIGRTTRLPELREIAGMFESDGLAELLKRAPGLQTLRLSRPSLETIRHIESASLTTLNLGWTSLILADFLAILKHCPSLANFWAGSIDDSPAPIQPVVFSQMISLHLRDQGGNVLFLNAITLPRLHTLLLRLPHDDTTNKSVLAAFLDRSRCPLTRFGLYGSFESAEIYNCIQLFPGVESLEMHDTDLTDEFPCKSGIERFRQATFPKLRYLHIQLYVDSDGTGIGRLNYEKLCDLLVSLRPKGGRLEKLVISIEDSAYSDFGESWFPSELYARVLRHLVLEVTIKFTSYDYEDFCGEHPRTIWWPHDAEVGDAEPEFHLNY
ncbi:F-box domain-containing protein [Mycena kentingensis (nom. inval.)]|nr:F-box domain-containing protein [Mycena kentingensis (nom. inval.)]